jgi:hypothetical protein
VAKKKKGKEKKNARRRRLRIKPHKGPVQLWLPLQMPLGLLGGEVVPPEPVMDSGVVDDRPSRLDVEQSSLF